MSNAFKPKRISTTLHTGHAVMTDAEIARALNERHNTTRHKKKQVSAARWNAERKLKKGLAEICAELQTSR